MRTARFGTTSDSLPVVGLGGMPMSIQGRPEEAQSLRTIAAALDAGMLLIDTADVYCLDQGDIGHNERVIANGVKASAHREDVRIATKGGLLRPDGAWTSDASPGHLKRACEASLKALGVDRIWLYQLHAPDGRVPLLDSVGALKALKDEGKIEHIGLSNVSTAELDEARTIVDIASVQNRCNLEERRSLEGANSVLSRCESLGIAFLPYCPVGGGRGRARLTERADVRRVAKKHGVSAYEILLAWLLAKSPVMFPIPGASRPESAISSAHAASVVLDVEDLAALG